MLHHVFAYLKTLHGDETGATAVEYGLIVALIAAIIVTTVALVGQDVLAAFTTVANNI